MPDFRASFYDTLYIRVLGYITYVCGPRRALHYWPGSPHSVISLGFYISFRWKIIFPPLLYLRLCPALMHRQLLHYIFVPFIFPLAISFTRFPSLILIHLCLVIISVSAHQSIPSRFPGYVRYNLKRNPNKYFKLYCRTLSNFKIIKWIESKLSVHYTQIHVYVLKY